MFYHEVIGFPPAPSAPVHFAMIDSKMVVTLHKRGWVFEYSHRLANKPSDSYKVLEWKRAANVRRGGEAQS